MNLLITIVIVLICLVILCMIYIVNCHNNTKKQGERISYILEELDKLGTTIWCIQHPPKYKIGDKVKFYKGYHSDQRNMTYTIRDIIHDNSEMRWKYLLDDNQPKYAPRWYSEISIHERLY